MPNVPDPDRWTRRTQEALQTALELLSGIYRDGDTVVVDVAGDDLVLK